MAERKIEEKNSTELAQGDGMGGREVGGGVWMGTTRAPVADSW